MRKAALLCVLFLLAEQPVWSTAACCSLLEQAGSFATARPRQESEHQQVSNPCKRSGSEQEWTSGMRERGIKSVGVDATFSWNGGVDNVVVTNLSYHSSIVTPTSGGGSRLDVSPDSDAFSKTVTDAARPVILDELQQQIPKALAKSRLVRARGSIVVILNDDPCVPTWSQLGDLVDPDISPLMKAASRNQPQFYALLQAGADVNAHDQKGVTSLMIASFSGNVEGVEALLKRGAMVNERDIDGKTALHYAAENRQGADVGTQYRSVIFYRSDDQLAAAKQKIAELNEAQIWPGPIATELSPCPAFYEAEGYHQGYFRANGQQPYCQAVVSPKVAKFRSKFVDKLK